MLIDAWPLRCCRWKQWRCWRGRRDELRAGTQHPSAEHSAARPLRSPFLPQALHRCQLRHVIALWQLLSAHKSEQQLRLRKVSSPASCSPPPPPPRSRPRPLPRPPSPAPPAPQEPFAEIAADYGEELSQEGAKLLRTFLNQGGLDTFLLELHELMVLKLKNPQTKKDFNPNWR